MKSKKKSGSSIQAIWAVGEMKYPTDAFDKYCVTSAFGRNVKTMLVSMPTAKKLMIRIRQKKSDPELEIWISST